jgi:putative ABC transport system substrate-binding protein
MSTNLHFLKKEGWLTSLFLLLAAVLMVSACNAEAAPKVYRVGILGTDTLSAVTDGFKEGMTKLGYVEGQNVTYDIQKVTNISTDKAQAEEILKKFVSDKVDLIFTYPTGAVEIAKEVTAGTNIPILFTNTIVEGTDLIKTVSEPGGNLTGARALGPDLAPKRLEFLHQIAPQAKKVLLLHNPDYPSSIATIEVLEPVAPSLGIELVVVPISSVEDIETSLQQQLTTDGQPKVDAILIITEPLNQSAEGFQIITTFASEHNLPLGGSLANHAEQGALFSYVQDNLSTGRLVAPLADKILHGISAGTIPIVTPNGWLRLNVKRAQELGLTIPEGLLNQANEIIR